MSGTILAIISGTIMIIAVYLILTRQGSGASGGNAFTQVLSSTGQAYIGIVKTLMGGNA